jgi:hypothetical protein
MSTAVVYSRVSFPAISSFLLHFFIFTFGGLVDDDDACQIFIFKTEVDFE